MFFKDFQKDAFGYLSLDLAGKPGTSVEWAVGEVADGQKINRAPGGYRVFRSGMLTLEEGKTHYPIYFPKHVPPNPKSNALPSPIDQEIAPFRYVEINGECEVLSATRHEIYPATFSDDDSYFESTNEDLNRIWEFSKYSMKATAAFGMFIDGERERLPYEGDTYINQLGYFACCADREIPRKTIEFFKDHATWPTEWNLLTPILARDYLLYTGDYSFVEQNISWLPERLLASQWGDDGLVRGNSQIRDIVDWPVTERDEYVFGEVNFVPNAYLICALEAMYGLTGDKNYLSRGEEVRKALRQKMFRNGLPTDNPNSPHTALHTAIFALWAGIHTEEELPLLKELIRQKGMSCSVYGAQFLLEVCFQYGMQQHALELMTSHALCSWNNMLAKGATITMEAWDDTRKPNQDWNHAWGAAPANIIPHYLCGLRPVKPGFAEYICQPAELPLDWKLKHPTPWGYILAEYVKGQLTCKEVRNRR